MIISLLPCMETVVKSTKSCEEQRYISLRDRNLFFLVESYWKVVLCVESWDTRTQGSPRCALTKEHKNSVLKTICERNNPRCLQYILLESEKPAVANLKLHDAKFTSTGNLNLTLEIETRHFELLRENDVETCVHQCLKENKCENFVLCNERG